MPGGPLPALAGCSPVYAAARSRRGSAHHRAPARRNELSEPAARGASLLPLLAATDAGGLRALAVAGVRFGCQLQPLRGEGGPTTRRRAPRLLLLHADALCLAHEGRLL